MTFEVGPKGQMVIAKEIRDQLAIEPGGWRFNGSRAITL